MGHVYFLYEFLTIRSCIVISYCNNVMKKTYLSLVTLSVFVITYFKSFFFKMLFIVIKI